MREILFRGKRTDNGEWVNGGSIIQFIEDGVRSFYMPQYNEICTSTHDAFTDDILGFEDCRFYKVGGETICQYTGMEDINGVSIYEGDIVVSLYNGKSYPVRFGEYTYIDDWGDEQSACGWYTESDEEGNEAIGCPNEWATVIGNIYDNPELLKGEEK